MGGGKDGAALGALRSLNVALLEPSRRKLGGQTPPSAFSHQPRSSQTTATHWENRSIPIPREKLWLDTNSFVPRPKCFEQEMKRVLGITPGSRSYPPNCPQLVLPVSTDCSSELFSEPAPSLKSFLLFKGNIIAMKGSTSKRVCFFFLIYTYDRDHLLPSC